MRARRVLHGSIAVAVLLGAAACTSDGEKAGAGPAAANAKPAPVTPAAAVTKAVKKVSAVKSLRFTMDALTPGAGRIEAEATIGLRPRVMEMTMKGIQSKQGGPQQVRVRVVDDVMYIDGGAEFADHTGGKRWLKLDFKSLGKSAGGLTDPFSSMGEQANQDPSESVRLLEESKDIKKLGDETVDGVRTTHYAGTVAVDELDKLAGRGDAAQQERLRKSVQRLKQAGADVLTLDIWIGPDDRTVKFRERATTKRGPLDVSIRVLDINVPVHVQAPAASETFDFAEVMKRRQKQDASA